MKIRYNQSGYAIYTAIIIMLMLSIYTLTIIKANHGRAIPVINKINKLQAEVCAQSGLNLVQAFASGYDGHSIHSEIDLLNKNLNEAGTVLISTRHDAGWLRVKSKGIHNKDTICLIGILGQSPPEFTSNVLNVFNCPSNLVIAERARVYGDIGISGKGVITKSSGTFSGKATRVDIVGYDYQSFDDEYQYAFNVFKDRKSIKYFPDSLLPIKVDMFKEIISQKNGDIFIEDNLILEEEFDFNEKILWIDGDLIVRKNAEIKNIKAYVTGDSYLTDKARLKFGSIICFGNVKVMDKVNLRLNIACAESLIVSNKSKVEYPSVLYVSSFLCRKKVKSGSSLIIKDDAHITGTLLVDNFAKSSLQPKAIISGRTRIEGFLFSPSSISINGRITGNVSVNKLIYEKPGCVYDGWLMEVTLQECDLSEMIIPLLFPENCKPRYLSIEEQLNG